MDYTNSWHQYVEHLKSTCAAYDSVWMRRRRVFDTYSMISVLLDLAGEDNASYINSLFRTGTSTDALASASSLCEARRKFPSFIINEIREEMLCKWDELNPTPCDWYGYNTYAVDGSKLNLPQTLVKDGYHLPSEDAYYPQGLLTALFRTKDRMICDLRLTKHHNERLVAHSFLEGLTSTDVVIYDRGFLSFGLICDHIESGVEAVFRVSHGLVFEALAEAWLDDSMDKIIEIEPTSVTYRNTAKAKPELVLGPQQLRVIKYKIGKKIYMLATTILDQNIPRKAFVNLYAQRWCVEEFFKFFKVGMKAEKFHAKTETGVEQEIAVLSLSWNMSRSIERMISRNLKKLFCH